MKIKYRCNKKDRCKKYINPYGYKDKKSICIYWDIEKKKCINKLITQKQGSGKK
jgi:hypothetical protein